MNVPDHVPDYLMQLQADGRAPATVRQYARHLRLFAGWIAATGRSADVADLRPEVVAAFLGSDAARLRPDGALKRAVSVNALRTSVRTFTAYLHAAGHTETDVGRLVRMARCGRPVPRAPRADDVTRLLATIGRAHGEAAGRDAVLVRLLAETGARIGSALAIRVRNLDLDRGELHLRATKGDAPYVVPLSRGLVRVLRRYVAGLEGEVLFPVTARHVARRLADWSRKAGIAPVAPHALRHHAATELYRRTRDVLLVQQLLGHRDVGTTSRYARADREDLRRAVGRLAG